MSKESTITFRLLDFRATDVAFIMEDNDEIEEKTENLFTIDLFGIDDKGDDYCISVREYKPFLYIKVRDDWNEGKLRQFIKSIKENELSYNKYAQDSISYFKLVKKEELYGFDDHKKSNFIYMKFKNKSGFNAIKNLFYNKVYDKHEERTTMKLKKAGLKYRNEYLNLYEGNIPPLLRFFHIRNISPSGWIKIPKKYLDEEEEKSSNCKYEYSVNYNYIVPDTKNEKQVPYKICSFDIEASSSHGDFPIAVKNYKKLSTDLLDYWDNNFEDIQKYPKSDKKKIIKDAILTAFGYSETLKYEINRVYPKKMPIKNKVNACVILILKKKITEITKKINNHSIKKMFEDMKTDEIDFDNIDYENNTVIKINKSFDNEDTIIDILMNTKIKREEKLIHITEIFNEILPQLEGDKVTFIGSTFVKYGQNNNEPYLNNCIALNTCDKLKGAEIECYNTENEVLVAWAKLIQRENPDIIVGYNIFGFDYKFMTQRARENGKLCLKEFLKLSRYKDEICGKEVSPDQGHYELEKSNIKIASGTHDLEYIKMQGRIQIDLYNYFRREYNLTSYKLNYTSGHFIGDKIKNYTHFINEEDGEKHTFIKSKNITGLKNESYINIEVIGHSSELYNNGMKFQVYDIDDVEGTFKVKNEITPDENKILRWCLAKDDVSPQDIFRMTNEGSKERSIIAKYCIQDCNLVHHLLNKIDVITGIIEMSNICSVPIDFIVMRGQGIKLFSFIAKKCREVGTLIPVLEKKDDGGYEGAIVLPPKCGLYLDEPIACVDYSSLYPSSMISENLSHDSKVWSLEYDLEGKLINETGIKNIKTGKYIYDNLPDYEYVDVEYDTYEYIRKSEKSAAIKTKVGYKRCRFAQSKSGELAIMPRILKDLLAARKATRTSAKWKNIITDDATYTGIIVENTDYNVVIKDKDSKIINIEKENINKIEDTYDDFMKNVLDKRQLAIKLTANSLYGQCGAKTSSFYEKDVAASTTAIGRKLLTYGKRIIEDVYGNRICKTKYGTVKSNAEYIYGDTDSVFMSFKLTDPETGEKIVGKEALKHTIELSKEAGELATKFLKPPHDLEYEKTFMPFCLLSKKRYVGMLYEENPDICFRKSMGIVLKRRDNAPIVKDVYGGIIDILMKEQNVSKAIEFTKNCMQDIVNEKFPLEKLIITKSLRAFYKNPKQIAHKVLADRIGKRDPGNKPGSGDRIPFVYIQKKGKVKLQGDKIEHPEYIIKHKLKPDYTHYITNQIMKPVQQVFALVLQDIPEFNISKQNLINLKTHERQIKRKYKTDENKIQKYIQDYRNIEVKKLIFDDALRKCQLSKNNQQSIKAFFE